MLSHLMWQSCEAAEILRRGEIPKIQKSLTRIPEAEFRKTIEEKWVEKLEQCVASQGRYYEKDVSNPNDSEYNDDDL